MTASKKSKIINKTDSTNENYSYENTKGIKISTCGKLILCGEHAVMYGFPAIALGINQRLNVDIQIVNNEKIEIVSTQFGSFFLYVDADVPSWANQIAFLLTKFISTDDNAQIIKTGIKITIDSNVDDCGFGSSGAVFACIACGLELLKLISNNEDDNYKDKPYRKKYRKMLLLQEENKNKPEYKKKYRKLEAKIKKMLFKKTIKLYEKYYHKNNYLPSGIDVATSIFGGAVWFRKSKTFFGFKYKIRHLPLLLLKTLSIKAIFCGQRATTADAVKMANSVKNCKNIYRKIGHIVKKCATIIWHYNKQNNTNSKQKNINSIMQQQLLTKLTKNETLLEKLNLADADTNNILQQCKKQNIVAKISGSGLGDCILALIDKNSKNKDIKIDNYKTIDIDIDEQGLSYEFYSPRSSK